MKHNNKVIILVILIFVWLGLIFMFSNQSSNISNNNSINTIKRVVKVPLSITNKIHITKVDLSDSNLNKIADKLNYPLRKVMHMSEYFILTILVLLIFKSLDIRNKNLYLCAILICFSAANFDEIHQFYVGRTGQFIDVLVDCFGGLIACGSYYLLNNKRKNI